MLESLSPLKRRAFIRRGLMAAGGWGLGEDVLLADTEPMIRRLAEKTWAASCKESRIARTVVLKLKTGEFQVLTRSQTRSSPPASCEE